MRMKGIIATIALVCCIVRGVSGQNRKIYFNIDGAGMEDGSAKHPFRNLDRLSGITIRPGDQLLLAGGQTFHGRILLQGIRDDASKVFIGAYGTGHALIDAGDSTAIFITGCEGVAVSSIDVRGSGRKNGNHSAGIVVDHCSHVSIAGVDISGFQKSGLLIYECSFTSVDRVFSHDNGAAGITIEGDYQHRTCHDISITRSRAENNPGDPANLDNHSGDGIVAGNCKNILIDHCTATNNGWDMPRKGNGPVGIWAWEADSVVIQYCLAYRNKTSDAAADGGGFDFDGGVQHSIIRYCFSYENEGSGLCMFQYAGANPWRDNTYLFNISVNDGSVSDSKAGIYIWNNSGDSAQLSTCRFYRNYIYNSGGAAISFAEENLSNAFQVDENVFVARKDLITGTDSLRQVKYFRNAWWSLKTDPDAPHPYRSYQSLRSAEQLDTIPFKNIVERALKQPAPVDAASAGRWLDTDGNFINAHGAGVLYIDSVYYLFGEIKRGATWLVPGQNWEDYRVPAGGVSCYSSTDFQHWVYRGVALSPKTDGSDLDTGMVIERPKVIYNAATRKFVMWMHIDSNNYAYARAGVAISDKPEGPYRYLGSVRPNGQMSRDMTLFRDDDGKAYLVYSSENNQTMQVCRLSEDYLHPTTDFRRILIGRNREAPALFKNAGRYYLLTSACTGWSPNSALLATAVSPMGPWKELGNPCRGPGSDSTFGAQSTYVIHHVASGEYIFMADRWNKADLPKSGYLWLPLRIEKNGITIRRTRQPVLTGD